MEVIYKNLPYQTNPNNTERERERESDKVHYKKNACALIPNV
jgi:hypothetical protein